MVWNLSCTASLAAGADCIQALADALAYLLGSQNPDGDAPPSPPPRLLSAPSAEHRLPNGTDAKKITFVVAGTSSQLCAANLRALLAVIEAMQQTLRC
jgi:hypothetical protein